MSGYGEQLGKEAGRVRDGQFWGVTGPKTLKKNVEQQQSENNLLRCPNEDVLDENLL